MFISSKFSPELNSCIVGNNQSVSQIPILGKPMMHTNQPGYLRLDENLVFQWT